MHARACAVEQLLEARTLDGYWVGELSSSALSTATAVGALAQCQYGAASAALPDSPPSLQENLIHQGLDWLARHANGDGGWGDTERSLSNLSTTVIVWSVFGMVPGADQHYGPVVEAAERWIKQRAGRLEPHILVPSIANRYGRDRTFSVPILMTAVLGGRLGPLPEAWRHVLPLPFELAVLPQSWFAALRLPVVSYALPALISIGYARHQHRPPTNPLPHFVRNHAIKRAMCRLESIQPASGGFLEATPLTSFVIMALASSGKSTHPVVTQGLRFLASSVRPDGSWPIDTNLATWLTTLASTALMSVEEKTRTGLDDNQAATVRRWLLAQQYRQPHPYTGAAPGGWAWTDLSGGVPDADDTAGALLALRALGGDPVENLAAASAGLGWLLGLQNRDGGIPTFCRGWGHLPFDRSSADLTAHALRAWLVWLDLAPTELQQRLQAAITRAVQYLIAVQQDDGAWVPLWFGNQFALREDNPTYGTARVLCALPELVARSYLQLVEPLNNGALWLVRAQLSDGSWGGVPGGPASIEETALAVEALANLLSHPKLLLPNTLENVRNACDWGTHWLVSQVESGAWRQPSPIGFYFARLWYYEKLYPLIFTVSALNAVARIK